MRIAAIAFAGFRGARESVSLEFPRGFVIVAGRNGTGKSTLCDAIEFALSGDIRGASQHTEKGEGIRDYIWWRGESPSAEPFVQLVLSDDAGKRYTIRRTPTLYSITPTHDLTSLLCEHTTILENPLSQLCRTSIIRDEEITRLSVDLKETDRFAFVRAALGTADFAAFEEKARHVREIVEMEARRVQQQYEIATNRIQDITYRLSDIRSTLPGSEDLTSAEDSLRLELTADAVDGDELLRQSAHRLAELRLRHERVMQIHRRVEYIDEQSGRLKSPARLVDFEATKKDLDESVKRVEVSEAEHGQVLQELTACHATIPQNTNLAVLLEHGERVGLVNGRCPLCGTEQREEHYRSHLRALAGTVAAGDQQLASLTARATELSRALEYAKREVTKSRARLAEFEREQSELAKERAALFVELNSVAPDWAAESTSESEQIGVFVESQRASILRLEQLLAKVQASRTLEYMTKMEQDLTAARDEHATVERRRLHVGKAMNEINDALDIIRRVRGEYVDEQLAQLEPLLLELYQRLRPHIDWPEVRYRLRGDVRRMLSFEIGDGLNPSFVFSSGQRRAAGLAFLLTLHLSRRWCTLKTLILDDPVQHIDDYRALHLTEVLVAIRASGRQVVCTVEDDALAALLARRLKCEDDAGGLLVKMGYSSSIGIHVDKARPVPRMSPSILVKVKRGVPE